MTTLLPILHLLTLILTWKSEPDMTYTAQVSGDLRTWDTLPFVITGDGSVESLGIADDRNPLFARLCYSGDGDTDENGLPDLWEWQWFGRIGADPGADPDGDGRSNHVEWLDGSDPTDFFDGERPLLRVSSGVEWILPAGALSAQPLAVSVCHASGEPWPGAPVLVEAVDGLAGLVRAGEPLAPATARMVARTDARGRLPGGLEAVHVRAPGSAGQRDALRVSAGAASAGVLVRAAGTDHGPPPRELQLGAADDGSPCLRWQGDPGAAAALIVEQADSAGGWRQILTLARADFPDPDPLSGRFAVVIE